MEATASENPTLSFFFTVVACTMVLIIAARSDDATKIMYRWLAIIAVIIVKIATVRFIAIVAMDTAVEFILGLVCQDLRDAPLFQGTAIPKFCASPRSPEFERPAVYAPLVASILFLIAVVYVEQNF